jgi:hypothetical protein
MVVCTFSLTLAEFKGLWLMLVAFFLGIGCFCCVFVWWWGLLLGFAASVLLVNDKYYL